MSLFERKKSRYRSLLHFFGQAELQQSHFEIETLEKPVSIGRNPCATNLYTELAGIGFGRGRQLLCGCGH